MTTRQLVSACGRLRLRTAWDAETIATAASLRALARRIRLLDIEIADHTRAITTLVRAWRPDLLTRCGVGPIVAAVGLCAWSHPGRCRSDAAFAMLGGAAPIPASSGQTVRVRRNRSGDRQLNQALDTLVLTRLRTDPTTRADALRRRARARPSVRSSAAWSATSPASSTGNSRPDQQLTQHRSVHLSKRCPGSGTSGLRPGPAIIPIGFNLFGVDPQVRVWFAASYLPQRLQIPAAAAFIVVGALAVWWATAIQRTSTGDR